MQIVIYNVSMNNNYLISYNYPRENALELKDFHVYQIGRIICNKNTFYDNHCHGKFYELTIVTDGEGLVYTNNKPVKVKKGDIYLSCPYDVHAVRSDDKNPLKYDFCAFYPKDEELEGDLSELSKKLITEADRCFHSNRISSLLPLAIAEMDNLNKKYSTYILNNILCQISVYIIRILNKASEGADISASNKKVLCYQIMDYISTNISTLHHLTELSEAFNFSYNYLSEVFKEVTSMKVVDFYNLQRLTFAQTLLSSGNMTLEEIAEKTNYSTPFALSKAFKRQFGVSPATYKKVAFGN